MALISTRLSYLSHLTSWSHAGLGAKKQVRFAYANPGPGISTIQVVVDSQNTVRTFTLPVYVSAKEAAVLRAAFGGRTDIVET